LEGRGIDIMLPGKAIYREEREKARAKAITRGGQRGRETERRGRRRVPPGNRRSKIRENTGK